MPSLLTSNPLWAFVVVIALIVMAVLLAVCVLYQGRKIMRLKRDLRDSQHVTQRFSDLLSHELRNPMNAITGHLDLLETANPTSEAKTHIHRIRKAARSLIDQLDDIISIAVGFRADDEPTSRRRFSIVELCQDVIDEFTVSLAPHEKPADINLILDERLPAELNGPRKAIRIALRHLVSNAIQYGHNKAIAIEVSYNSSTPQDGILAIRVRDQGLGLSQHMSRSLFSLFSRLRAHDHTSSGPLDGVGAAQGIGRGLPISKQVIERCGGRIGFLSRPNHGSVFWLRVPVQRLHHDETTADTLVTQPKDIAPANQNQNADGKGLLVIVDDMPSRAEIFSEYLSLLLPAGCDVIALKQSDDIDVNDQGHLYLIAGDCYAQLSQETADWLLERPMLILDYSDDNPASLPSERLAGPYDPDLLTRLDDMADNHPIRQLMTQASR
ncbi:MAG: HAMP domain-containing sensor histidine kinase [Pseudomonadota bacterium]